MSRNSEKQKHQEEGAIKSPATEASEATTAETGAAENKIHIHTAEAECADTDSAVDFKATISKLEAELSDLKDQYLRKAADFENYRKRMVREKQDAIDFANQNLLLDIIPVLDDFERAMKAAEASLEAGAENSSVLDAFRSFLDGIKLIERRLVSELENKWSLVRFESAGQPFDPNRHEAMMMEKDASVTEPTVKEDFIRGYTLKERIVRAAKVSVVMPSEDAGQDTASEE